MPDNDKIVDGQTPPATPATPKEFSNTEIADKSIGDLLEEIDEEEESGEKQPQTPPVEAKTEPVTPPVEEKKEEVTPPAPQIDPKQLAEEASNAAVEKLLTKLQPTATKEEKKDIMANAPWVKENRNPTWEEALSYVGELSAEKVKADLAREAEEAESRAKEEQEIQAKQAEETSKAWNNYWDTQLNELEAAGRLPKIADPKNPKDPGRVARVQLFQTMQKISDERVKKGLPVVMNLKEVYYEHFQNRPTQPPGGNAPVHGSHRSVSPSNPEVFYNDEIRNTSFEDLLTGK